MCGRFQFSAEESAEILDIVKEVQRMQDARNIKNGEVFPTNQVPVLLPGKDRPEPALLTWGFPGFKGKSSVIINARAETALEKPMFCRSLEQRRCIIPSTGFYEWNSEKQKYLFRTPALTALYMAGLYHSDGRFVILTTAANQSISDVHSRMPMVLPPEHLYLWLSDFTAAKQILSAVPPMLERQAV